MAQVQPIGKVWLLKDIPWSKNYQHTAYFADATTQFNWICKSSHVIGSENQTPTNPKVAQNYIKDPLQGTIKISGHSYTYRECNYICWQNTNIGKALEGAITRESKYYYAFVDEIRFTSNSVFEVDYTIDVLQTFLFGDANCSLKKCFIERQHVNKADDVIGANISPENITTGNMVLKNHETAFSGTLTNWKLLVYTSLSVADAFKPDMGIFYKDYGSAPCLGMGVRGGMFQGLYCNVFENASVFTKFMNALWNGLDDETEGGATVDPAVRDKRTATWINSIVSITAIPSELGVTYASVAGETAYIDKDVTPQHVYKFDSDLTCGELASASAHGKNWYLDKENYTTELDGFKPKNKKLFTSPFNYIHITDGDGGQFDYPVELFNDASTSFRFGIQMAIQPNPEIICYPYGFPKDAVGNKGIEYRVTMNDLPQYGWLNDMYLQWLATSRTATVTNAITKGLGVIGGAVISGVGAGGAVAGVGSMALNTMAELSDAQSNAYQQSDSTRVSSAQALCVDGSKTFHAYQKCVNEKDGKRIDNFFSTYGYSQQTTGTVHFTNTKNNQHFVKTKNCCCVGGAPSKAITQIENIFNSGITIWNGGDTVGTYTNLW